MKANRLTETDRNIRLFRNFIVLTLVFSLILLAAAALLSFVRNSTVLLWYMIAFILPFEFFLLALYSHYLNAKGKESMLEQIEELGLFLYSTITSISMAIDAKEQIEYGNILKVRDVSIILAENHPNSHLLDPDGVAIAALVHDIGKLAVPEGILNKPGGLTESEISIVQRHAEIGAELLETVPFPPPVAMAVRYHHERWEGGGYPSGLSTEDIPLEARILSVADAYVSLRSNRPFRPPIDTEKARKIILDGSGIIYDPEVVQVFKENVAAIEAIIMGKISQNGTSLLEKARKGQELEEAGQDQDLSMVFNSIAFPHREMQAEFEITRNMARTLSLKETFKILVTWIKRFVPYTSCVVYRFDDERRTIRARHAEGKNRKLLKGISLPMGEGVSGKVALDLKPLYGISPEPDFPPEKSIKGLNDCLVVPMAVQSEAADLKASAEPILIGVIALYSDEQDFYTLEHAKLMRIIAQHAAMAINNSIIHNETREDAFTDSLTGLPNIRFFKASIENEIHRAQRLNYPINFLMMDLDNFKAVNDIYGHQEGDRILVEIGELLKEQFRKSDICIRYGGDEFLAILPGIGADTAEITMNRINDVFTNTIFQASNGDPLKVGISIGSSSYPKDGSSPEVLLETADLNMYRNKKSKRGTGTTYRQEEGSLSDRVDHHKKQME